MITNAQLAEMQKWNLSGEFIYLPPDIFKKLIDELSAAREVVKAARDIDTDLKSAGFDDYRDRCNWFLKAAEALSKYDAAVKR